MSGKNAKGLTQLNYQEKPKRVPRSAGIATNMLFIKNHKILFHGKPALFMHVDYTLFKQVPRLFFFINVIKTNNNNKLGQTLFHTVFLFFFFFFFTG